MKIKDDGPEPNVFDIENATVQNSNYRTVAWSGKYQQVTLMSIPPGSSIGLEKHPETDQFIRIDAGTGRAKMGTNKRKLETWDVGDGWSVQVPAGMWHDIENTGEADLKLYVVYAPVHHAAGAVHRTSEDADAAEEAGNDEPPEWSVQPAPDAEDEKA